MKHKVAVIAGDGIGPEVLAEGVKVLNAVAEKDGGFEFDFTDFPWGCQYYLENGRMMAEDGMETLKKFDAIFLGAVGYPGVPDHISLWDLLLVIRKKFDQYINVRPVKLLHGAPMRENGEEYPSTYDEKPPYEVKSTPWLSENELSLIHTAETALDRLYNSHRYPRTLSLWRASAFDLFLSLGERLATLKNASLNEEITLVYNFFKENGVDEDALRDAMLIDLLSTNSSRLTPTVLRREDGRLRRIKSALSRLYPEKKGVRRAVCVLSGDRCAFVDYTEKDSVNKRYPLRVLPVWEILNKSEL